MQPDNNAQNGVEGVKLDEISEMYTPETTEEDANLNTGVGVEENNASMGPAIDNEPIHWRADEFTPSHKGAVWYISLVLVVLAIIAIDIFFIKSYTFSILVVVMAIAVVIYSRRPPKEINYTLSGNQGLYIGEKLYHFSEFKAFGLLNDQGRYSVVMIPTKRFSLGVSVYFPEELGEQIVDILGARLPMKDLNLDFVDVIVRKLRL